MTNKHPYREPAPAPPEPKAAPTVDEQLDSLVEHVLAIPIESWSWRSRDASYSAGNLALHYHRCSIYLFIHFDSSVHGNDVELGFWRGRKLRKLYAALDHRRETIARELHVTSALEAARAVLGRR